jgi:hypothetical protein
MPGREGRHGTYKNGTTITAGTLLVANERGSGTGNGLVNVTGGTIAGGGIIAGNVEVGTSTGGQGFLAPSEGMQKPATLTIQRRSHLAATRPISAN